MKLNRTDWVPLEQVTLDDRLCKMLDSPDYGEEFGHVIKDAQSVVRAYSRTRVFREMSWRRKYTQKVRSILPEAADALGKLRLWLNEVQRSCPKTCRRLGIEKKPRQIKVGSDNGAMRGQ